MSDVKNLIFPMTAGDLVQSAVVVGAQKRGDGVEMQAWEVMRVENASNFSADTALFVTLREQVTLETMQVVLKHDTPLLITDIRRS